MSRQAGHPLMRHYDARFRLAVEQIALLVRFSCRQKAFRDLGGRGLDIAPAGPALSMNE